MAPQFSSPGSNGLPLSIDRELRQAAVRRLLELDAQEQLTGRHVQLVASSLGVGVRSVWRWLKQARDSGQELPGSRPRFVIDVELRRRLAYWRGNVSAVHRELVDAAAAGGPAAPSMATLQRAVKRDLTAGERAGLRKGEHAARAFDVFLQRPITHRNDAWEADHVEAPVQVNVEGQLLKPWITWFVDVATNAICGTAITAGYPNRASILAALRAAINLDAPYGPPGGLPSRVRIDRGKDFLSGTVTAALGVFAVTVADLPSYTPHLKGTVEGINSAAKQMLFAEMPRYTHAPKLTNRKTADPDAPALTYEAFVTEVLDWVKWWNTRHTMPVLDDRTPLAAWEDDPTPVAVVPGEDLRLFTLEDDGRTRKITTKGVSFRGRAYVGNWMTGRAGTVVRVRFMPHHDHEIEVFDIHGAYLGAAFAADAATKSQVDAVRRSRRVRKARLESDLRAAEKTRRRRYAASTTPGPAEPIGTMSSAAAAAELVDADDTELLSAARPELLPPGPPEDGWVLPQTGDQG